MKKMIKAVLCMTLVLGILFSFGACRSKEQTENTEKAPVKLYITGRYELQRIEWANGTIGDETVVQHAEEAMGDMYVELFSDGTAQLALYGGSDGMEFSDDKMWQIGYPQNSYYFSVSGGKVTLTKTEDTWGAGDTYIFVKK